MPEDSAQFTEVSVIPCEVPLIVLNLLLSYMETETIL